MMFGTGLNAELTRNTRGSKYKNIYINKQTSPIFNCVTPESVSLARQLYLSNKCWALLTTFFIGWYSINFLKPIALTRQYLQI